MIHLVIGGVRSGKSAFAETQAAQLNQNVSYIATATSGDDEMRRRIAHHKKQRPQHWSLIEEPLNLAQCLVQLHGKQSTLLIDCMTLWLSNWLCAFNDPDYLVQRDMFIKALVSFDGDCVIVSNEVGSGIVPMGELSRRFADQAGWLNQALAKVSNKVTLVVAGLPLVLKE